MGLKEQILEVNDVGFKDVEVPEWGVKVRVRTMEGSERDAFESRQLKDPHKDLRARLTVATLCDDTGRLVFGPDDVAAVGKKNSKALDRIFAAATKLNGLTKEDVEELRKNS